MIDSFEFNKISGAILATLLFLMGLGMVSNSIFSVHKPEKSAYALPEAAEGGAAPGAPAEKAVPIAQLLAKADAKKGEGLAKSACSSCHTFDKGGATKQGPNLYGVVGRNMAGTAGFAYSTSMKAAADKDKTWSFEHLASFITNPRAYASNTKMAYAGLKNPERLADVLVYLRTLSDSPVALPAADAAPAPKAEPAQAAPAPKPH